MVFWSSVGLTVPFLDIFCKRPSQRNKFGNFWALLGTATYLMTNVSPEIKRSPKTPLQSVLKYVKVPKKKPNKPSALSRMCQNSAIFKIALLLGPFIMFKDKYIYLQKSKDHTKKPPKSFLNMLYSKNGQRSHWNRAE